MRYDLGAVVAVVIVAVLTLVQPAFAGDILTVTGNIAETNRGPSEPFRDAFFNHHDKTFQKAFAFDRAALQKLPQLEVRARIEGWPAEVRAKGPLLSDVLKHVGASESATVSVMSLDGYAAAFDADERKAHNWIVAIEVNGEELGLGGRGPTWLMYDTGGKTLPEEMEDKWIWSAFLMTVE